MRRIKLHLVSDSTGETVCSVAQAVMVQFEGIEADQHIWPLIRTKRQMEKVTAAIEKSPGVVMYTVVEKELRDILKSVCAKLNVPCIPVLSRAIADLSVYLNMQATPLPGKKHEMDDNYFQRVEAVNFSIAHDDGQMTGDIDDAEIILVGVSRTSKTPTSMYLAHRGFRTANIPYVQNCPLLPKLFSLKYSMIVGLTIQPERLVQIRKSRLLSLNEKNVTNYIDLAAVQEEINESRKLFTSHNWPVIDVTRKSVEETAATIIQLYNERKN